MRTMRFSLHILFALATLAFVSTAAVMGAQQGISTVTPGGAFQQAADAR